jgi:hypothetical protein
MISMVEVEVLFSSGQGILLQLEDREAALQLMKRVMDANNDQGQSLFHLSTDYEELLLDLADISFVRVKKEHHPLLSTKLRLNAGQPETTVHTQAHRSDEAIPMPPKSEPPSDPKPDTKDAPKQNEAKPESEALSKAQDRLSQAEAQLRKVEEQRKKIEDQIRKQNEILEDEVREAKLKKKIEDVEIGNEIDRMKGKLDK